MNEGFFSKQEVSSISRPDGKKLTCNSCGLYQNCHSPRFKPQGNFKKGILNIFDQPSDMDDKNGKMFQSKSGKRVVRTYKELGIDIMEDCLNVYALRCAGQIANINHSIDCCRRFTLQVIQDTPPKVIILFGDISLKVLVAHRWKKELGGIQKWRGWTIPDQDFQCWVCPVFGADYVERSFGEFDKITAENTVWVNDLKQVVNLVV
jgi:uracil-DNA glycosylase family 4